MPGLSFTTMKRARPFRPFRIHLASGKALDVADPEFLAHAATSRTAALYQPDGSFDAVVCREGLMFAVEPQRAVGEVFRILRPGGRAALSVWAAPAPLAFGSSRLALLALLS